ncbi:hypothetical protein [Streptomyces sp. NPDC046161]|uniref:hypothetical protein n=1 Tax=Streptomyces sp. NPDC046161 TaxID=3155132 RepID=UPI0033FC12D7
MMRRITPVHWLIVFAALIAVGLWPAAVTPIALAGTGAAAILGAIPGPALLLIAAIAWLHQRSTTAPKPTRT